MHTYSTHNSFFCHVWPWSLFFSGELTRPPLDAGTLGARVEGQGIVDSHSARRDRMRIRLGRFRDEELAAPEEAR